MVLDRGAGERQAVLAGQQAAGLGGLRGRVLDRLGLVEDHGVEVDGREVADVAADGAVGRDDEVGGSDLVPQLLAVATRVLQHLEVRCEAGGLVDPVVHEAPRRDDEVGQLRRPRGGAVHAEHGQRLDCLAQPHVVRQHAAEAELAQEAQPAQAEALIVAERADEAARLLLRFDRREGAQFLAQLGEGLADVHRRRHR